MKRTRAGAAGRAGPPVVDRLVSVERSSRARARKRLVGVDRVLVEPPDAWGGRTLVAWASRLSQSHRFDPAIDQQGRVLGLIDDIYERARETSQSPSLSSR